MLKRNIHKEELASMIAKRKDYQAEFKNFSASHKYVVFYGCGSEFKKTLPIWKSAIEHPVHFCCDSDPAKWGKSFDGIPCISPDELIAMKDDCAVVITARKIEEIGNYLDSVGISYKADRSGFDISDSSCLCGMSDNDLIETFEKLYAMASDQKSVDVLEVLATRIFDSFNATDISKIYTPDQYFPDIVKLSEHENFVDGGCFDGDTIREFLAKVNGKFDHIYAFELDMKNFLMLQESWEKMPAKQNIEIFPYGLWDEEKEVSYMINYMSSLISEGEGKAKAVPLDLILRDKPVSFIKMDIEGAEVRALKGAQEIIRTQKPKMAVCVYHDIRHIWEVPFFLKRLVPEYKIYYRHHSDSAFETVCYAMIDHEN